MSELDRTRLEQDAQHMLDVYDSPSARRVAMAVLAGLADPSVFIPEGFALVKRPELLGLGVPTGEGRF